MICVKGSKRILGKNKITSVIIKVIKLCLFTMKDYTEGLTGCTGCTYSCKPLAENLASMLIPIRRSIKITQRDLRAVLIPVSVTVRIIHRSLRV